MFFLLISYLAKFFRIPTVDVDYETATDSQVTGSYMNRQYYVHYLDNNTKTYYDFNRFGPIVPLPAGLSQEEINQRTLGHFLRQGDYVRKVTRSTILTVHRGDSTTQWVCSPKAVK